MAKVLLGFMGNKLVVVDQEITEKAKQDCIKEGCTKVMVYEWSDYLYKCWAEQTDVDFNWFKE